MRVPAFIARGLAEFAAVAIAIVEAAAAGEVEVVLAFTLAHALKVSRSRVPAFVSRTRVGSVAVIAVIGLCKHGRGGSGHQHAGGQGNGFHGLLQWEGSTWMRQGHANRRSGPQWCRTD